MMKIAQEPGRTLFYVFDEEHPKFGFDMRGSVFTKPDYVGTKQECEEYIARVNKIRRQNNV